MGNIHPNEEGIWLCVWCGEETDHRFIGEDDGKPIFECLNCGKRC